MGSTDWSGYLCPKGLSTLITHNWKVVAVSHQDRSGSFCLPDRGSDVYINVDMTPNNPTGSTTHTVYFVARYVSGDQYLRTVFYSVDGGSDRKVDNMWQQGSWTFQATFSSSIHVYVNVNQGTVYYEELYIDGRLVASGNVGNEGLWYQTYHSW